MSLLELFVDVDDFCKVFLPVWRCSLLESGDRKRMRSGQLILSEIMTIVIYFHFSNYRTFKAYYTEYVCGQLQSEFQPLVSYPRFVALMPTVLGPLCAYLRTHYGRCSGISFIDSTTLSVCDNHRIHCHRVFSGVAERGKNSMGWFYGFKLHFVINDCGELLACRLTPGNVDDRTPVPLLCQRLSGKLFGDKGYLSQPLFEQLLQTFRVTLITKIKSNMKNRLMNLIDKILLRKRALVETVIDQLKNISQIEHTRHRSVFNFVVNVMAALIAYCHQPKKPSLNINRVLPLIVAYP
jgi:hypothetical protein